MAYFQYDEFREATSPLTGRRVLVNESETQFFVPADLNLDRLRQDVEAFAKLPLTQRPLVLQACRHLWKKWTSLAVVSSRSEAVNVLEELVAECGGGKGQPMHVFKHLLFLWARGHVAFPVKLPRPLTYRAVLEESILGPHFGWLKAFDSVGEQRSLKQRQEAFCGVLKLSAGTMNLQGVGDLTRETSSKHALKRYEIEATTFRYLKEVHQEMYSARAALDVYHQWRKAEPPKSGCSDQPLFTWATGKDASLAPWCNAIASWLAQSVNRTLRMEAGSLLLRHLCAVPGTPRNPLDFFRVGSPHAKIFCSILGKKKPRRQARLLNMLHGFAEHVLRKEDKDSDKAYENPFSRVPWPAAACETHRTPVPLRFVRELIEILRSDWAKNHEIDYVEVAAPDGGTRRVWCPVRSSAILLKLMLPLRTDQVRLLGSDEGDTLRWLDGCWVPNTLPTAPPPGSPAVRQSFLRAFTDLTTGAQQLGFFVMTNKASLASGLSEDTGHKIRWTHTAAIQIFEEVAAWQARYNPLDRPAYWETLSDREAALEDFPRKGPVCFLMRDPTARRYNEPISSARVNSLWYLLLDELERRLAERGETLLDGSPIRLITARDPYSKPRSALFDLHTLRVTLITALATEGGVPLPYLSKCIAGHQSIVMTLHYVKLNTEQMNQKMNEAALRMEEAERDNFLGFLKSVDRETRRTYVSNDPAGPSMLDASSDLSWSSESIGVCPTGRTLCDQGGPSAGGKAQPTPGGPRNCLRCRYFISGPAFLPGLVARFNSLGVGLHAAAEEYRDACLAHDELDVEQQRCRTEGRPFGGQGAFDATLQRRERATADVDRLAHDWHACYGLVQRSKAVLESTVAASGTSLVLGGSEKDLEVGLRAATEVELMNAVCQSSHLYPCPEVEVARLRRGRVLNAILAGTPQAAAFATLSREESMKVGNEITKLLLLKFSGEDLEEAAAGRKVLDAAGLTASVAPLLEHRPAALQLKLLPSSTKGAAQ